MQVQRNIIRKAAVIKRTGLCSTTIWRQEKAGKFPQRVQLTDGGICGWFEDEVDAWIRERVRGEGKKPTGRREASSRPQGTAMANSFDG